jgi:tripeptidyl-peptidase-1
LSQESSFEEITASREFGSRITSGGGFSKLHSRPKYQEESVESYFARGNDPLLPPGFQDPGTRAYPDVMMIGHAVGIIDQAKPYPSDGTSAGAPILSGLVALWNVELKSLGKSQLGFLNPLLYHLQEKNPQVFVDIISGNNRCGLIDGPYDIPNCCKYGFSAGQGFDPVSGLGRPLWSEILKEILNMTTKSPE